MPSAERMRVMKMTNTEASRDSESTRAFSLRDVAATYAFRFNGYTMLNNIRYFLLGVGKFKINSDGNISGNQQSSITSLQGQKASLETSSYDLTGIINLDEEGAGNAVIRFTKTEGNGLDVEGNFFVQVAGSAERLWFISSGASVSNSGTPADELVTLEAIRMRAS
jgi:hypothetical protein